jgi:hypothetical protein
MAAGMITAADSLKVVSLIRMRPGPPRPRACLRSRMPNRSGARRGARGSSSGHDPQWSSGYSWIGTAPTRRMPMTAPASVTPSLVRERIACVRSPGSPHDRAPVAVVGAWADVDPVGRAAPQPAAAIAVVQKVKTVVARDIDGACCREAWSSRAPGS